MVVRTALSVLAVTRAVVPAGSARSAPVAKLVDTTGMMMPGAPRVPPNASVRPGWPSLKTMTALAPASWASCAFWPNGQVPRWTRAMLPLTKVAKSAASQPLVDPGAGGGGSCTSTACTVAVTSPLPE